MSEPTTPTPLHPLFDPTSLYGRMRASVRAAFKMRGYFHWLMMRVKRRPEQLHPVETVPAEEYQELANQLAGLDYSFSTAVGLTDGTLAWGTRAGEVGVWDPAAGTLARGPKLGEAVTAQAELLGDWLASGYANGEVRVWNWRAGAEQRVHRHAKQVIGLAAFPAGRLVSADLAGQVRVWDLGSESSRTLHQMERCWFVRVISNGRLLVGGDDELRMWDGDLQPVRKLSGHSFRYVGVLELPGNRLALRKADGDVRIWDLATNEVQPTPIWVNAIEAMALLPTGEFAGGCRNGEVRVGRLDSITWELASKSSGVASAVAVLGDRHLVSGSSAGEVRLWDSTTRQSQPLDNLQGSIQALGLLRNGLLGLVSTRQLRVWDPVTGTRTDFHQQLTTLKVLTATKVKLRVANVIRSPEPSPSLSWSSRGEAVLMVLGDAQGQRAFTMLTLARSVNLGSVCRAFLIEPEVMNRLEAAVSSAAPVDGDLLQQGLAAPALASNFDVARLFSAIPELEGTINASGEMRFETFAIPDDCDHFPPRPGPLTVVVVIGPPVAEGG